MRALRTFKVLKILKYWILLISFVDDIFKIPPIKARIIVVCCGALLAVHIFGCTFYMSARLKGFNSSTWVNNRGQLALTEPNSYLKAYSDTAYWAFQTLTTVGYGDFGAYND